MQANFMISIPILHYNHALKEIGTQKLWMDLFYQNQDKEMNGYM